MGLGLHGGGLASALFFARHGASVTVTDNRDDPQVFAPLLPRLEAAGVRTVLGRHEPGDFIDTDLIIKNPAVPSASPFLQAARDHDRSIETDLSVFLQLSTCPLIAVTGSKGKSTTAAAIHHCLRAADPGARLGGNITVSPLSFLDEADPDAPVVLELSSWQLGDIRGRGLLAPLVSVVTVILPDHQDRYPDMDSYIADKKLIFSDQTDRQYSLFNFQDPLQRGFEEHTRARVRFFSGRPLPARHRGAYLLERGAVIREAGRELPLELDPLSLPGEHNRLNLLAAGLACCCFGASPDEVAPRLRAFPGIEHRLELAAEVGGVRYYNDSAATIPEATAAALKALQPPIHLITGGTDKRLDFGPLMEEIQRAETVILLRGSATAKLQKLLARGAIAYLGPFDTLEEAVQQAVSAASAGSSVLFSPASASFELFLNEFDRGRKFKKLIRALAD
ncbi:MAG: UDP-N-acetylmuramoyl-L-alanine--D-glutamate ligase [Spirochaetales bacterium]|nr:UDP-N-acetylmuramoyl-L-alanine--D-glutamate ligase [Spirochaetales bacterium]